MISINEIWTAWRNLPFPSDLQEEHFAGVNFNKLLDDAVCSIEAFLENHGQLNQQEMRQLEKCRAELKKINPAMVGEAQVYFGKLYRLCDLVLHDLNTRK